MSPKTRKPILVTGSHKSGTTWAGRMLSGAPNVGYIQEPFNIGIRIGVSPKPLRYWFQHICDRNAAGYHSALEQLLRFQYPLRSNLARAERARDLAKIARDQALFVLHQMRNDTPLIKDPIALLSAEWLHETFDMSVLVMIRHPAAFCSSLKIRGWKFDFRNFLDQRLLMEKYLHPFHQRLQEYARNERSVIDQGILLWTCLHYVIAQYREQHSNWLYVRHEDLSLDPLAWFQSIYSSFGLEFTQRVRKSILKSSGSHNPAEFSTRREFMRNSRLNIWNWKERLEPHEIDTIREGTCHIADLFYAEDEW
jgi:hypothetical protein